MNACVARIARTIKGLTCNLTAACILLAIILRNQGDRCRCRVLLEDGAKAIFMKVTMPLIDAKFCVAIALAIKGIILFRSGYKLDQYVIGQ